MINQLQHINVTIHRHIDRIQITLLDYGDRVLRRLKRCYVHKQVKLEKPWGFELLHNFRDGESVKLSYIHYPKPENPFSTLDLHDVTLKDQYFLIDLLKDCHRYWIKQVEFAMDIIPENKSDLIPAYRSIDRGLVIPNSRVGCFRCVGRTHYWGTKNRNPGKEKEGDPHAGSKGLRLYPGPKEKPWGFVRLELQANKPLIEKRNLELPIAPDAVNPFDFIEYRTDFRDEKAADIFFRRSQRCGLPKRQGDEGQSLWNCIDLAVTCLIVDNSITAQYEGYTAVADQISGVKEKLPFLKHRIDDLFPKWPEKKEQLLEDLGNGFIRRVYDLPDRLSHRKAWI
jgi:hypothetical protein